ncbi:hypothetical protein EDC96DRAFT_56746 [Choanephora cucurbitarum]|nr:hypothetical protein EDC96DRAFT_529041 [Choanephora cucurbitarum]KAI8329889.1 hypothetical protein EDC96DRAFT_56746 [Choanephora cucurbitarum]
MKSNIFSCLFFVSLTYVNSLKVVRSALHGPCGRTNQVNGSVAYFECIEGFHCFNYRCYEGTLGYEITSETTTSESMD